MFFFRVALLSKYDEGRCLTHVDTEGGKLRRSEA